MGERHFPCRQFGDDIIIQSMLDLIQVTSSWRTHSCDRNDVQRTVLCYTRCKAGRFKTKLELFGFFFFIYILSLITSLYWGSCAG